MGNRAFVYLFLIAALSFLFTAVSAAVLSVRKTKSLRMGAWAWTALFLCAAVPLIAGDSVIDLILYGDWSGGMRVVTAFAGRKLGQFYIPYSVLHILRGTASFLTVLWITAGAASLACRMSSYFNNVHFLTKRSRVCRDSRANTVFEGAMAKAGVKGHVPLRVMDKGLKISPCTCGILSPCVFVGEDYLRDYDDTRLELIFLHELTHVRRHDTLLKLMTLAVTSMHVFLPTSGRIRRAVLEDSEMLCDLDVLRNVGKTMRGEYIGVIIDAAERSVKERDGDLLSSVSAEGAFILRRYRNMQEPSDRKVMKSLAPTFAWGLTANVLLMCILGVPNMGNPGVDIADDMTREALCAYFGLDDPEDLTEAHMAAVYSVAYTLSDHRKILGDDHPMRFTRKCVINEGLYPGEDGYLPYVLPESRIQAECSILPGAVRGDLFHPRLPEEFYIPVKDEPEISPCSVYETVCILRDDLPPEEIAAYLLKSEKTDDAAMYLMGDRVLDLRDLTLFTGLRNLTLSKLLTPAGFDPDKETDFAVIRQ